MSKSLSYEGCNYLRQRLVLATLSSRPVKITTIRADSDEPGLKGKDLLCTHLSWIHVYVAIYTFTV